MSFLRSVRSLIFVKTNKTPPFPAKIKDFGAKWGNEITSTNIKPLCGTKKTRLFSRSALLYVTNYLGRYQNAK
ncbi:hypothetical protein, partial [Klebsiella pneumoniae]|uniref:hypothetical protein n=1 Tax=Klebsiella pneumoniae TaxID=573 RepID=UPI0040463B54